MTSKLYSDPIDIPLIKLKLDPDNVRFRHIGDELTESQIETYLFEEEDVRLLMKGIISARQLYQQFLSSRNLMAGMLSKRAIVAQ